LSFNSSSIIFALISLVAPLEEVPENYTLIFKQDFTSEEDLEKNWDSQIGIGNNGWGNQEKEYYRTSKNNVYIKDNQLHIRAVKEKIQNNNYTSARIITKTAFKFKYGYLKTRVKLPKAKGIWPAFWLLGSNIDEVNWPKCGEIDIIEAVNDNDEIYTTVHWFDEGTDHKADYGTRYNITKRDEFHDYEFYWDEKYIRVFVDGSKTYEIDIANIKTNAFTKEFYLLLNVAVGGLLPGFDIDDSKFPLEMVVDYIEVYQKNINYKHTPKNLIFELAPEIKPWPIEQNEHIFLKDGILHLKDFLSFWLPNAKGLPCFKYGEIKMTVSLPDKKGISTKIYLFKRDKFYNANGEPTMINDVKGEIAKEAMKILSEVIGKPINYCSSQVAESIGGFGGNVEDSAFIDIKSIGGLQGKQKELADKFCSLIESKTPIKGGKIYLNFTIYDDKIIFFNLLM